MARNADLVKEAMQLADDGGDLLGQIACVHGCDARPRLQCSTAHAPWVGVGSGPSEECGVKSKARSSCGRRETSGTDTHGDALEHIQAVECAG